VRPVILVRVVQSLAMMAALCLILGAASANEKVVSNRNEKKVTPKTPLAAYQKQVTDAIGSLWYRYTEQKLDLVSVGTVRMNFRILANGHVTGLRILSNTSNEQLANLCSRAVLESRFPPIPDAVRRETKQDFVEFDNIGFTLYPN
jgi:hypothetical protein